MATRFCPECGTEVDESASFCPTCGQPLDDLEAEVAVPPAPTWPEPPQPVAAGQAEPSVPADQPPESAQAAADERPATSVTEAEATRPHEEVPAPIPTPTPDRAAEVAPAPTRPPPPAAAGQVPSPPSAQGTQVELPFTWPVTLSSWLIGIGALVGALGALLSLFLPFGNAIDLLIMLALVAMAATVFLSASLPAIPHLRLITLAVVLVALGVGLDRIGLGGARFGGFVLFLGAATAATGALLLELGRDRPMGGPSA